MKRSIVQRRATTLGLLACTVLLSCGQDGGETASRTSTAADDPGAVVQRFYAALGRGDGRTVCSLMTPTAREGMRQLPEGARARSCERAVVVLARNSIRLRRPQVRDLRVSGRTATAVVTSEKPRYENGVLLRREGRGWRLAYPPGFASRFDSPPGIRPHEDEHKNEP